MGLLVLAYAARSKRRLFVQPVERLSTASVVPGSMKQARGQTASQHHTRTTCRLHQRARIIERCDRSLGPRILRAKNVGHVLHQAKSACRTCVRARTNETRAGRTRWNKNSHRRLPTSANAAALDASRQQHKTSLSVLFSGRPRDAPFVSPDAQRNTAKPLRNRTHSQRPLTRNRQAPSVQRQAWPPSRR